MNPPTSKLFSRLVLDFAVPDSPTLNGNFYVDGSGEIEVALVGQKGMRVGWARFLERAESQCGDVPGECGRLLTNAGARILELHHAYFPNRWVGGVRELLDELRL